MKTLRFLLLLLVSLEHLSNGSKTPDEKLIDENGKRKPYLHGRKLPDTCPDVCLFTEKCVSTELKKKSKKELQAAGVVYFTEGSGDCVPSYAIEESNCPSRGYSECIAKCGGKICTDPEGDNEKPVSEPRVLAFRDLSRDGVPRNFSSEEWVQEYNKRMVKLGRPLIE